MIIDMLLALGSNGSGQLGLGHEDDVRAPTEAKLPDGGEEHHPVQIAAGGNHTLVLLSSGDVFATGEDRDGRCAVHQSVEDVERKQLLQLHCTNISGQLTGASNGCRIKFCSATWEASMFVSQEGNALTCGTGQKGELGQGQNVTQSNQPNPIPNFPPPGTEMLYLSSGMSHTVAVLSNGEVWGWGGGRKGQLGQPATDCWSPRKVEGIPFKAVAAVCGRDFTYVVGSRDEGEHIILGSDKWRIRSAAPAIVPSWKDISASWGSIYVLLEDAKLLAWGRNDHGQLPPDDLPPLKQIAVGSEHVLATTAAGDVVAWGWGEHGNCGEPTDSNGDVKNRWNQIAVPGKVTAVGAGCATSWIHVED